MTIRSWPIRVLFPVMAGSILISAIVTAGGATLAAHSARDARTAVRARSDAQLDLATVQFLNERIQLTGLAAVYVPSQTVDAGRAVQADLESVAAVSAHLLTLPLDSRERAAMVVVGESFRSLSTWLASVDPATAVADAASVAAAAASFTARVKTTQTATKTAQALLTAQSAVLETRLDHALRFSNLLVVPCACSPEF
jgi:hypothetical protein